MRKITILPFLETLFCQIYYLSPEFLSITFKSSIKSYLRSSLSPLVNVSISGDFGLQIIMVRIIHGILDLLMKIANNVVQGLSIQFKYLSITV